MHWSWTDLMSTPPHVVDAAFALMEEVTTKEASAKAQQELHLRALKNAKRAAGKR